MEPARISRRATGLTMLAVLGLLSSPLASTASAATQAIDGPPGATVTASATPAPAETIATPGHFAVALLRSRAWPVTSNNVCAVLAWETAEGGQFVPGASQFNPLNTTMPMPGDSIFNSVGVRNYPDWATGITATATTLDLAHYTAVVAALASGTSATAVLAAIDASPWGTKFPDPAAAVSTCLGTAASLDADLAAARSVVDSATANLELARGQLAAATAEQSRLDAEYQKMSDEIRAAQANLGRFARSLYIAGIEPAIAGQVEAVESGDPIGYSLRQAYPNNVGRRQANSIKRSLDVLVGVASSRQRAAESVAAAVAQIQEAERALGDAQQALGAVESRLSALDGLSP